MLLCLGPSYHFKLLRVCERWTDGKDEITFEEWINLEDRTLLKREDLELPEKCILDLSRETSEKDDIHTALTVARPVHFGF